MVLLAFGLTALAACAPSQPTRTPTPRPTAIPETKEPASHIEDVCGVWRAPGGGGSLIVEFKSDGTFGSKDTLDTPYDSGLFWFEGNQLMLQSDPDSSCPGDTAIHEASVIRQGDTPIKLELRLVDEPCEFRVEAMTNRTLYVVEP